MVMSHILKGRHSRLNRNILWFGFDQEEKIAHKGFRCPSGEFQLCTWGDADYGKK